MVNAMYTTDAFLEFEVEAEAVFAIEDRADDDGGLPYDCPSGSDADDEEHRSEKHRLLRDYVKEGLKKSKGASSLCQVKQM